MNEKDFIKRFSLLKDLYEMGDYSLREMFNLVTEEKMSKEMFHFITSYDYNGLKISRGW